LNFQALLKTENENLRAENARLHAALKWYVGYFSSEGSDVGVENPAGDVAREALVCRHGVNTARFICPSCALRETQEKYEC